jgi:hypothetical protein
MASKAVLDDLAAALNDGDYARSNAIALAVIAAELINIGDGGSLPGHDPADVRLT